MARRCGALCRRFGAILREAPSVANGVCTTQAFRRNIRARILGRRTSSILAIPSLHSFESMDRNGRALCLGETVLLAREINPYISRLRRHGIQVTALHNHWLFDRPNLWYIHHVKVDRPLRFAQAVRNAKRVLTRRVVR